jgi:hypothetical protein
LAVRVIRCNRWPSAIDSSRTNTSGRRPTRHHRLPQLGRHSLPENARVRNTNGSGALSVVT